MSLNSDREKRTIRVSGLNETVRRKLTSDPTTLTISGTSARCSALTPGDYYLKSTCDCYVKQGGSSVSAGKASGTPSSYLIAGEEWVVKIEETGTDDQIAAITDGAAGTLFIKAVEAV